MKIAFALYRFFPFGGLQRNMRAMAEEAVKRGHQVTVFCGQWDGDEPAGVVVRRLPSRGMTNAARASSFNQLFQQQIRRQDFDVVVGFNKMPGLDLYYAADSCFAYKAYFERGPFYRFAGRTRSYLDNESAVFAPDSSTCILEVSAKERERFQRCYKTPDERFFTLPPGISRNRSLPENYQHLRTRAREELALSESAVVLLALGSGFRTKGLDRSIAVLADLRRQNIDAWLMVVGEDKSGPYRRQAATRGVSNRVRFLGGRDDVPALLQAADVLLHPAYKENTGNVLLEAMIAGKPVVTTDVCGYAHYIEEASMGYVIKAPYSVSAFSSAINQCLGQSADYWRQLGKQFSKNDEIYSRPVFAVDVMEQLGHRPL